MFLFDGYIGSWKDWGDVFQSISAFEKLVEHIMHREGLPFSTIENLTPGTNAVFKVGKYVIKIFAPVESGIAETLDIGTELFATRRANDLGVAAPKVVADGFVSDKYVFAYMITEYVEGTEFTIAAATMTDAAKTEFGRELRHITDIMNTPCEPFNRIDVINDKDRHSRWDRYPRSFRTERLEFINSHNYGEKVFVHGDLCGDNILLPPHGGLCIIDFADAVLAPKLYEHALVAVELFKLDPAFLRGYFHDFTSAAIVETCFGGLLIHDFGGDIVAHHLGNPEDFPTLAALCSRISCAIEG